MGIEVTRRYLERADVVLLCVPAGEGLGASETTFLDELGDAPVVVLETMADEDRRGSAGLAPLSERHGIAHSLRVSAMSGEGLAELRALLPRLVYSHVVTGSPDAPVLTRRRQREALAKARGEVEAFGDCLRGGLPVEVAATHLRTAESALEDLLGVICVEDVLDVVFAEFCVGK
jgi:tRNA modification GTPase